MSSLTDPAYSPSTLTYNSVREVMFAKISGMVPLRPLAVSISLKRIHEVLESEQVRIFALQILNIDQLCV